MSLNGIWKLEMLGPYGWESISTAFLEDGKYRGGSRNHYSLGSYQVSGEQLEISVHYVTHGEARTMFGKKVDEMDLDFKGELGDDQIQGHAWEKGSKYSVTFRAVRLADLPE